MVDDKMVMKKVKSLDDEMVGFREAVRGPKVSHPFSDKTVEVTKGTFGDLLRLLGPDAEEVGAEEFESVVEMCCKILNDAVEDDVLDPEMSCDVPETDEDLRYMAAKLKTALKDSVFRRWLKEQPTPATSEEETVDEGSGPSLDEQLIAASVPGSGKRGKI